MNSGPARPARCLRTGRRKWRAALLLLALCWGHPGFAAETGPLRRALVPADRPEAWPAGDWERVPLQELNEFERAYVAGEVDSEPQPQLERAVFRGKLVDQSVLKGDFHAGVRRLDPQNTFLELGAVTPALAELSWTDEAAVWGVARDGTAHLYVDRDQGELHGNWVLRAQPLIDALEFDVRLPPAASLRLELLLPEDRELRSSQGLVLPPESAADGLRLWIVELGQTMICQCTVVPVRSQSTPARVLAEWVAAYTLRADGCRLQADFNVLVPADPPATLEFLIPPELQNLQATTVTNTSLPAKFDSTSQPARLILPLPEHIAGRLGTIRISGDLSLQESHEWALPEVRLAHSTKLSGVRRVHVDRPLQLQSVTPRGMRQTDLVSSETSGSWMFEDMAADAQLTVRLGRPAASLKFRALTIIDWSRDEARFRSAAQLTSQGDRIFHAELQLPEGWGVVDVGTPPDEPGGVTAWHARKTADGVRLEIEFRRALTSQSPRQVVITGRRIALTGGRLEIGLFPRLASDEESQVLLAVGGEASAGRDLTPSKGVRTWQHTDVLADWAPLAGALNTTIADEAHAWFVQTARGSAGTVTATIKAATDRGTGSPVETPSAVDHNTTSAPLVLDLSLESELGVRGTAWHRHRAVYRLHGHRPDAPPKIRFPAGLELDLVAVDGRPQNVVTANETLELLEWNTAAQTVEIRYRSPVVGSTGWLKRHVEIPLPDWGQSPRELEWRLRVPRTEQLGAVEVPRSTVSSRSGTDWRRRLFGMLGRNEGESDVNAVASDDGLGSDGTVDHNEPAADRGLLIGALQPGTSVSIELVDLPNQQRADWLGVLGSALAIGVLRWLLPRSSRVLWVVPCALFLAALLLPDSQGEYCGSPLVGALVGLLLPRRWIAPQELSARQWGRVAATRTGAAVAGGGLLLAVMQGMPASAQTSAAPATTTAPVPAQSGPQFDVLIPQLGKALGSEARLQRRLLPAFQAWRRSRRYDPPWLLQSARYELTGTDAPQLRAEMTVAVFDRHSQVPVALPFGRLWVSDPDNCRVDGQPAQIRPADDSNALLVEIPGIVAADDTVRIVRVELLLQLSAAARSGAGWEFRVPPVLDSRLVLPAAAEPAAQLAPRSYCCAGSSDNGQPQFDLGAIDTIAVQPAGAMPMEAGFSADAVSLIEVHPLRLRIRTQLTATGMPGTRLDMLQLRLLLPARADVRAVTADALRRYSVRALQPEMTLVDLELDRPLSPDAVVSIDYVLPAAPSGMGIEIPPLVLLENNRLRSHRLGLRGAAGVDIAPPAMTSSSGPLREMPFAGLLTAGVAAHADWPVPNYEYIATAPTAIPVVASGVESVRSAALEQSLLVDTDVLRWQATAEVDVPKAQVFSHEFQLSPEVKLETVSLVQDGEERLLDWARFGDRLVLHVRGESTGRQQVRLAGTLRADPSMVTPFPTFLLLDATINSAELIVQSSAARRLELFAADGSALPVGPIAPRRFSQQDAALPAAFRNLPASVPLSVSMVSVLDQRAGQWRWLTEFRPDRPLDAGELLVIRVPPELAAKLNPLPNVIVSADGGAGDAVRLSPSSDIGRAAAVLGFSVPVNLPEHGDWSAPHLEVLNAAVTEEWTCTGPDVPFSPVPEDAAVIEPAAWPAIVRQGRAAAATDDSRVYRWSGTERRFREHAAVNGAPDLRLVETALWRERDGSVAGMSLFWVIAQQPACELRFAWPTTVELQSAFWDKQPLNDASSADATFICRRQGLASGSAHCLRLDWRAAAGTVAPGTGEIWRPQCELETPVSEDVAIVSPRGVLSLPRDGRTDRAAALRKRAEALLGVWDATAQKGESDGWITGVMGREIEATLNELDHLTGSAHVQLHARWDQARAAAPAGAAGTTSDALPAGPPLMATLIRDQRAMLQDLTGRQQSIRMWDVHAGPAIAALSIAMLLIIVLVVRYRSGIRRFTDAPSLSGETVGLALLGLLWWVGFKGAFIGLVLILAAVVLEWRVRHQAADEPLSAEA